MLDIVLAAIQGFCVMSRKTIDEDFGPNFGCPKFFSWVLPLLVVKHCSKLSSCAIWGKTNEPNLRKCQKNMISSSILVLLGLICLQFFLHYCKLSSYSISRKTWNIWISEKTNDPILRKLKDGRTDRETDRQTEGREWFHNVVQLTLSVQYK